MDICSLIVIVIVISMFGLLATLYFVPFFGNLFKKANLVKVDYLKMEASHIPDAIGVVGCLIYIICMVVLTPFLFMEADLVRTYNAIVGRQWLHWIPNVHLASYERCFCCYRKDLIPYFATLFCIGLMTLLGFVDDVLVLKRRRRLLIPGLASLPLVMFYFTSFGNTTLVVPCNLTWLLGNFINFERELRIETLISVDSSSIRWKAIFLLLVSIILAAICLTGPLYYLYICIFAVFCANSVDLFSGLNGVVTGPSIVISISIIIHNLLEVNSAAAVYHRFSLFFMIPFLAISLGLFFFDKYPAKVFVGNTYSFTAGMVFAIVSIMGHFSEIVLLFLVPQIFNLMYSMTQILRFLPFPRKRGPRLIQKTGYLNYSKSRIKRQDFRKAGGIILKILEKLRLARVEDHPPNDNANYREFNNLTLTNLILAKAGPMSEKMLVMAITFLQAFNCAFVLTIRYCLMDLRP